MVEFAPRDKLTGWMSYLQGSVPLGVMLGYFSSVVVNAINGHGALYFMSWRWPFLLQFIFLFPIMIGIFFIPTKHLSIYNHKNNCTIIQNDDTNDEATLMLCHSSHHHPQRIREEDTRSHPLRWTVVYQNALTFPQKSAVRASYILPRVRLDSFLGHNDLEDIEEFQDVYGTMRAPSALTDMSSIHEDDDGLHDPSIYESLFYLLHKKIFLFLVLGLSAVYFVVTGVQFWGTIYMIKSLHAPMYVVNGLFVLIAGTGPILGVFFGGWIIDQQGGYRGVHQRAKALEVCCYLGFIATLLAVTTPFYTNVYITAISLWLLLFFGGSILPGCTGIFISVVPRPHRPVASSVAIMIFNLLGYSLSPYLTGAFMSYVLEENNIPNSIFAHCNEACAYRYGFGFCLIWCLFSFLFISLACILARKESTALRRDQLESPIGIVYSSFSLLSPVA